ncbi:pilus assembly protein TadG-related protein [Agromyces silvae]|uniref:pilus assembly protein TadG-related protein n=1 Tax=Agromyces silvae TaxID=3388266 RepID=UPI00280A8F69|nr:pilus assembly protein TadG-related protein [Agromyces protaetiae]
MTARCPRPDRRTWGGGLHDETGSTLPLIVGFAALAGALILVVTAASSLYLERKRLFTVADGAALAAAEAWSFAATAATPEGEGAPDVTFEQAALERAVSDYLAAADAAAAFDGLRLVGVESADDRGVAVALTANWRWLGDGGLIPVEVPIEVVATARSVIR